MLETDSPYMKPDAYYLPKDRRLPWPLVCVGDEVGHDFHGHELPERSVLQAGAEVARGFVL